MLGFALRSVPMSIAGSCRFLCGVPSICLPVGSAAGVGDGVLISSVRDVLRCPACLSSRLVSRFVRRLVGRVGSCVSRFVLRHDGRGDGRLRCGCGVLFVLRSDFLPPASSPCLLASGRSRPRSSLAPPGVDGDGRLAVCRLGVLSAFLPRRIRAVPPFVALPFHLMARSIDAVRGRLPMLWV